MHLARKIGLFYRGDRNASLVKKSIFFDPGFYRAQRDDVDGITNDNLYDHYLDIGWHEGSNPAPGFNTNYYLTMHHDVALSGMNPLEHFMNFGVQEQRETSPPESDQSRFTHVPILALRPEHLETIRASFDSVYYVATYPDVSESHLSAFEHYCIFGAREGRRPSADFSPNYYISKYPELSHSNLCPFAHFVLFGKAEGREGIEQQPITTFPEEVHGAFDAEFYLRYNPDIAKAEIDPLTHYMNHGWKELRDPNAEFSTRFYLESNPDIAEAEINPFMHYLLYGRHEKRDSVPYSLKLAKNFKPLVSVIVPNFNHAQFLPERLNSIANQTYGNIEVILLDDCSSDNSTEVLSEFAAKCNYPCATLFNETNSGSVFSQWEKGVEQANGELIWICESDDFCEPEFLENLVAHFADRAVMIAFGKIEFVDEQGIHMPGMQSLREQAEAGIWDSVTSRPAKAWFDGALSARNVICNVGGCVMRKQTIDTATWAKARSFKIAGDWFLYCRVAGSGKIVFEPDAIAYFRQHQKNTSASNFNKLYYFDEHEEIYREICASWKISTVSRQKFIENIRVQYDANQMHIAHGSFDARYPGYFNETTQDAREHFLIAMLGFIPGGGELFPLHLANQLVSSGYRVSIFAHSMNETNEDMLQQLDVRIPVYDGNYIRHVGIRNFLDCAGITLIHSHMISCDDFFFNQRDPIYDFPYTVSLHGSHDAVNGDTEGLTKRMLEGVSYWVYTADKNLNIFSNIDVSPPKNIVKIPNAMPKDPRPFPMTREDLDIPQDAVIYTLVARGIQQKGWRASVDAFNMLAAEYSQLNLHLILVGTGQQADLVIDKLQNDNITYLGYQSCINGLYRISDCALVPTRYDGESFPLCIIQALQEGLPIISTDIGEIRSMLKKGPLKAGILLENVRNTSDYTDLLKEAIIEMANPSLRQSFRQAAGLLGKTYNMGELAERYLDVYKLAQDKVVQDKRTA